MANTLDTGKRFIDEIDEFDLSADEWDGLSITDWFTAAPGAPVPASARWGEYEFAHENPGAWQHVDLGVVAMSQDDAIALMSKVESRFNKAHDKLGKFAAKSGYERISAKEARGNSRPVSEEEYDRIAASGKGMLAERLQNRAPTKGLDENWDGLKDKAFVEVQQSWGGATINAHTGVPLESTADKYALTIKPKGVKPVSIPETASREEFDVAMDSAKEQFRPLLENGGSHLGVFHDDENHRIDIDPVVVVDTLDEVEAIGAYTHAIGGAYHFKSGDGFWPPHVAEPQRSKSISLGQGVHWQGPGEWRSYADKVQQSTEARFNKAHEEVTPESRAVSQVTRTVHYGIDSCEVCRSNTDPRAVPLHPHCTCNVATEDVQTGQTSSNHPNFRVMHTADETTVYLGESDLPAAIVMDPATTGVLEIDDLRFGDLARWLEQIEPYLSGADLMVTILEEADVSDQDISEVTDALAEGAEEAAESISNKRIWFGISKVVAGL